MYAALAVVGALVLTSRTRTRDLNVLRTLGLSRRQGVSLTVVEQLPPLSVAAVSGGLLGAAIARIIEPSISVTAYTGATDNTPLARGINWLAISALTALVLPGVVLAIGVFSLVARRTQLGQAVRIGDD